MLFGGETHEWTDIRINPKISCLVHSRTGRKRESKNKERHLKVWQATFLYLLSGCHNQLLRGWRILYYYSYFVWKWGCKIEQSEIRFRTIKERWVIHPVFTFPKWSTRGGSIFRYWNAHNHIVGTRDFNSYYVVYCDLGHLLWHYTNVKKTIPVNIK